MERRSDPRVESELPILASILGVGDEPSCSGRVTSVSGSGVGILVDRPLPLGEPIQVTLPGFILLAEVRHCGPEGDGHRIGLELMQRLTLEDLKSLADDLPRWR